MDYKELGIKAFSRYRFKDAKLYFSLAYEQEPSDELLFLIELAELALIDRSEVMPIFEFYQIKSKKNMDEFFDILNSLYKNIYEEEEPQIPENLKDDVKNSISYKEFREILGKTGDFKQVLEGIMFSSNITIESKDDMLSFLENLVENDFIDISLRYIEDFAWVFMDDLKFNKIVEKIKNNENSNRK